MWKYSLGNRHIVILFWILLSIGGTAELIIDPYLVSRIMNSIQENGGVDSNNLSFLIWCLVGLVVNTVIFWMFHGPSRVMEMDNAFGVRRNYRMHFLKGILGLPLQWHTDNPSGQTNDRIEKGTTALYAFSEDTFEIIYAFTRLVVSYIVLMYFSFTAGALATVFIVISILITIKIDKILVVNYSRLSKAENATATTVLETISNITTVIMLRIEKHVLDGVINSVDRQKDLTHKTNRLGEFKWFLTSLMCSLMVLCVMSHYFWSQASSGKTVLYGTVFILYSYLSVMSQVFFKFTGMYSDVIKRRVRTENAELVSSDFVDKELDTETLPIGWREIEIRNLCFSYPDMGKGQLVDINLKLKRGQKVAFVGRSGSCKSTMLMIMRGLYEFQAGTILVDGVVCKNGFADFGDSVALSPQHPETFSGTILYNLTLGAEYTEEQVAKALYVACFDEFVESLPKKLDSVVKEKGVKLSGGEFQRLSIARGMLATTGKGIVLLDEPTSSLDALTERMVIERISREMDDRLMICVTHKTQLLDRFDLVVVFDKGRVVGQGKPADLFDNCPAFRRLVEFPEEP
jgi:ABC-type multidrug transport system fused ATPase/permease subunit